MPRSSYLLEHNLNSLSCIPNSSTPWASDQKYIHQHLRTVSNHYCMDTNLSLGQSLFVIIYQLQVWHIDEDHCRAAQKSNSYSYLMTAMEIWGNTWNEKQNQYSNTYMHSYYVEDGVHAFGQRWTSMKDRFYWSSV